MSGRCSSQGAKHTHIYIYALTGVRDVGGALDLADLVHVLQVGAEAAVAAEDLAVNDRGHGERVETVRERLPQLDVVAALALPCKVSPGNRVWEREVESGRVGGGGSEDGVLATEKSH